MADEEKNTKKINDAIEEKSENIIDELKLVRKENSELKDELNILKDEINELKELIKK